MSFGKDFGERMSEAVEGGASLAWRLLATLEGGSLILVASVLLAYTARNKLAQRSRSRPPIRTVLVTNTNNLLGRELKKRLESRGCDVSTVTSGATSGADCGRQFDALVVVGAQPKATGLDGITNLVNDDICNNLKLLELLCPLVTNGGCITWACEGAGGVGESFSAASSSFDAVLRASLLHVAELNNCEPVWIGRRNGAERTAEDVVEALMNWTNQHGAARFTLRHAAHRAGEYVCRWLKIVT